SFRHVLLCFLCFLGLCVHVRYFCPSSGYCIGNECFTVFQDPSDYETARSQCRDVGGHLMTVRSSVSHDVLNILLGNLTGRFWIGLHLTAGCPDAAATLNGFEWVTKDSESDFFNWASPFDSSCSSGRCVSVSQAEDFKWTRDSCAEHAAGFLCEYRVSDPCKGIVAAEGETVTYRTPMGFGGEDLLSLPPGSTAIRLPAETKYVCFGEQWIKAPWTCEIHEGGCEYKCSVNPANNVTCEVAIEDPCLPLRCAHACYKNEDSWDGRSCVDYNDCRDERQCPLDNFKCVNTHGGFQCVCQDGYRYDDGDSDGGSGAAPTPDTPGTSAVPHPEPTRQPSAVTVGGLVGIILCTVFFIVLVVFLAQRILCGRGKTESADALKAREDEAHGLRHVTSDT
uniref:C-type lectin domain-containing protein n=1 Tax=Sparus aurata TaxID=8175 RepID=A0A671XG36_SPAAU